VECASSGVSLRIGGGKLAGAKPEAHVHEWTYRGRLVTRLSDGAEHF
jgi:hypothetical protein